MKYKLLYISSVSPKANRRCATSASLREGPRGREATATEQGEGAVSERSKEHLC